MAIKTSARSGLFHSGGRDGSWAIVEGEGFSIRVSYEGEKWDNSPSLSPRIDSLPLAVQSRIKELRMHRLSALRKDLRRLDNGAFAPYWNHGSICVCHDYPDRLMRRPSRSRIVRLMEQLTNCPPVFSGIREDEEPVLHLPYTKPIPLGSPVRSWTIHNPI